MTKLFCFLSPQLIINLIMALSLLLIIILVYLKNNNFELFNNATSTSANTTPEIPTTISLLSNDVIQNSALVNFINRFIINKNQQNKYKSALVKRQEEINNLSKKVINIINPST